MGLRPLSAEFNAGNQDFLEKAVLVWQQALKVSRWQKARRVLCWEKSVYQIADRQSPPSLVAPPKCSEDIGTSATRHCNFKQRITRETVSVLNNSRGIPLNSSGSLSLNRGKVELSNQCFSIAFCIASRIRWLLACFRQRFRQLRCGWFEFNFVAKFVGFWRLFPGS